MKSVKSVNYYKRSLDYGQCTQYIETIDGIVADQWLQSNNRDTYYTGDGNPEFIGEHITALRGSGFKKVSRSATEHILHERVSRMMMEAE